jgi:hypothetical protein
MTAPKPLPPEALDPLYALLHVVSDSILVVSADSPLVDGPAVKHLMDRVVCTLLLVR